MWVRTPSTWLIRYLIVLIHFRYSSLYITRHPGGQQPRWKYRGCRRTHDCPHRVSSPEYTSSMCQSERREVGEKQVRWNRAQRKDTGDYWARQRSGSSVSADCVLTSAIVG